jgi:hypothetical protein
MNATITSTASTKASVGSTLTGCHDALAAKQTSLTDSRHDAKLGA